MKPATPFANLSRVSARQVGEIAWRLIYAGVVTGVIFLTFRKWAYDDPFITYRYAQNLASGHGLVYNPGEQVLSTTTPLFALLLAVLAGLPFDLSRMANLIGSASLGVGGLCLWELGRAWKTPAAGWAGLLLYPAFPILATTLGSETPLYLALCLGAFAAYANRRTVLAAALSALAVLTRPDGVLVPAILGLHFLVKALADKESGSLQAVFNPLTSGVREDRIRFLLHTIPWKAVLVFSALILPWLLFAWGYYGSPVPATLATKQNQGSLAISQGFTEGFFALASSYAADSLYWVETGLAFLGLVYTAVQSRSWLLIFAWTGVYFVAYHLLQVSSYFWYYAPLAPGFIAAVSLGYQAIYSRIRHYEKQWSLFSIHIAWALLLLPLALAQFSRLFAAAQFFDRRAGAYQAVGVWLNENTPPGTSVGALEVGIIGYYAERRMIDFAGLIQPAVAHQLNPQTSYEDAALWAMKTYRPDFLVLHQGMFGRLEAYAEGNCSRIHRFPGRTYGYTINLQVYACGDIEGMQYRRSGINFFRKS